MEKKLKKNREYWSRRFEALEDTQLQRSEDYLKRVDEAYKRSSAQLQKDINYWYSRLAKNNDISLTEARKLLSKDELKEFHWSVEEYIEKGKTLNVSDEWAKALENASAKRHISRLEAMQTQMRAEVEQLYGGISEDTEKLLGDIYSDQYYRSIFELEKGIGIATTFEKIDKRSIEKALSKPWTTDGRTFSDRLWSNKASLITTLQTELTQAIIQGKNPQTIVDVIAKKVGETDKKKMERLVMTESAYIAQNGQRDAYKSIGVEEFEVLATLDSKTSEICRAMDGKHFPMSQYEIGVTAPPFHPWCRSTTVPYFNDEFTVDEQRAMRDPETGEYQTVPSTMKYKDWYEKYVVKSGETSEHGGVFGALNNKNDPLGLKREAHAKLFYDSIRNSDKESFIDNVSKNAGIDRDKVSKMYTHIFETKYELHNGFDYFDPSYDMAESFRRLRNNENIQNHDIILVMHESLEYDIMQTNPSIGYRDAHALANKTYNYEEALDSWLRERGDK